jgi:hypothetical protein
MSDPGSEAAGQQSRASAELSETLARLGLPALNTVIDTAKKDLGAPGSEPASVQRAYGEARQRTVQDFQTAQEGGKNLIEQQAKQQGLNYEPGAISSATSNLGRTMEIDKSNTLRALNFQEAQQGMSQQNSLINSLFGAGGNALSGSLKFGQNSLQSDQLMQQISARNASMGSTIGGLVGTGLGIALSGYTGGLSIPVGAAAGGAIGGWIGGG